MTTTRHEIDLRERLQLALGDAYQVGDEIGKGGMSRVFAARDVKLRRDIVVKTLPPELAGDISIERFSREIHFAASLQHPHIVPVHAAGDVDGLPYYTMPRVEGESLRERLNRVQRLPLNEVLTTMLDVGRALAYAHRRGLVHRDIKPENILIAEGMALVTDFGIAKALAAARVEETPTPALSVTAADGASLTATGTYLGTPNYVAPEQMTGEAPIDNRADLFAFGVVAYELLCGTTPYAARGGAIPDAARFATRARDVAALRLDVPPSVAQVVMQCIEADPAARPQSADEIVKKLDAAMSATPLAPVGDDPSVTRKAFAWYAVAFVVTTGLAWVAMIGLGLPDWVLPGAMILMALGLPVVTTAALTRRAAFQSSLERHAEVSRVGWLFTPGPMTVRLAQALTWRRVVAGGGMSLGAFGILVAGFMVTRSLGLGPAGSLLAKGQLLRNQSIILADFTSAPADSSLARVFAEVFSLGLKESNVIDVMAPEAVADALRRMQRDPKEPLTVEVARELAQRDGIRAIATGEVLRDGERLRLRVRLIAPDSGTVLTVQEASTTSANLIAGVDQLTRSLRSSIGESLKRVRETAPLERVTTSSFEALRLYTSAVRAHNFDNDAPRAWALLARAVELDSTFASAWRKLAVVWHVKPTVYTEADAMEAAFRHRANATEGERLSIEGGAYFRRGDRLRSIAAYEEFAVRTGRPHNNFAWILVAMREFARAESLYRVMLSQNPRTGMAPYHGLVWALMNQGKQREADSVARAYRSRRPNEPWLVSIRCGMREFVNCEAGLDSVRATNPRSAVTVRQLAELALMRGQLRRWEQLNREAALISTEADGLRLQRSAWIDLMVRRTPAVALARLDSVARPIGLVTARLYALANRPDSARAVIAKQDSATRSNFSTDHNQAKAALAVSEGKFADAVDLYRRGDRVGDGSSHRNICTNCLFLDLASVFEASVQADSAIAYYERFLRTPLYNPAPNQGAAWQSRFQMFWWSFINEAWVHERLGELYAQVGNRPKAITHFETFVELWKDADPELQPRVTSARNRIAQLKAT